MNPSTVYSDQNADLSHLEHDERFRKLWWHTEGIPGSFTRLNAAKYYEYALQVPDNGVIVEIGVDQGRSASVLMQAVQGRQVAIILVDSWESVLIDNKAKVQRLVDELGEHAVIIHGKSVDSAQIVTGEIDMLLIDANHYDDQPANDCEAWLPKLRGGGIACFHDVYATFPAVTEAVEKYTEGYDDLGTWDSLAIRRKP